MEKLKHLKKIIQDIPIAMFTSLDGDLLRSRPMAVLEIDNESEIWFFTNKSSPKSAELAEYNQVNLSFSNIEKQMYVSVSGKAKVFKDKSKIEELWKPHYKAWFPKGKDDPELSLLKVEIEAAEYWDAPSSTFVHLIGLVKATISGESYKPGLHEKINLS